MPPASRRRDRFPVKRCADRRRACRGSPERSPSRSRRSRTHGRDRGRGPRALRVRGDVDRRRVAAVEHRGAELGAGERHPRAHDPRAAARWVTRPETLAGTAAADGWPPPRRLARSRRRCRRRAAAGLRVVAPPAEAPPRASPTSTMATRIASCVWRFTRRRYLIVARSVAGPSYSMDATKELQRLEGLAPGVRRAARGDPLVAVSLGVRARHRVTVCSGARPSRRCRRRRCAPATRPVRSSMRSGRRGRRRAACAGPGVRRLEPRGESRSTARRRWSRSTTASKTPPHYQVIAIDTGVVEADLELKELFEISGQLSTEGVATDLRRARSHLKRFPLGSGAGSRRRPMASGVRSTTWTRPMS